MDPAAMVRVRFHVIRNARIENVGKSQSCMVSKLPIIWKQTVYTDTAHFSCVNYLVPERLEHLPALGGAGIALARVPVVAAVAAVAVVAAGGAVWVVFDGL